MKKKSIALTLTAVMLALAVGIGGTIAYFTADTGKVVNTFSTGNVDITLDEAVVKKDPKTNLWTSTDERTTQGNTYESIYPGAVLPKDPTIHVTENSQDAWIAMSIEVTKADGWKEIIGEEGDLAAVVKGHDEDTWVRIGRTFSEECKTATYLYMVKHTVQAKQNYELFTRIELPTGLDNDQMAKIIGFTMTAKGYAVQAQGVDYGTAVEQLKTLAGF